MADSSPTELARNNQPSNWGGLPNVWRLGERSQGYDPGPPNRSGTRRQELEPAYGTYSLTKHELYGKMASSSPQSSGPGYPLPQEPGPDDLGDRPHRTSTAKTCSITPSKRHNPPTPVSMRCRML